MRGFKDLLASPYFLSFVLIYGVCLAMVGAYDLFALEEPIVVLVIMGLGFPGIAYWVTVNAQPFPVRERSSAAKLIALGWCVVLVTLYLSFGKSYLEILTAGRPLVSEMVSLGGKLLFAVVVPFWIFRRAFGLGWRDFGLNFAVRTLSWAGHRRALVVMVVLWLAFQYFVGSGASAIREGAFSAAELVIGLPIAFAWLVIEVGLVEEFFFRALLQNQLAIWLRSDLGGIFVAALVFGLAHAPGLYLRGAGSVTVLGETPSLLAALTYSVVMLAVAGLVMGVLWARTRNLLLLMLIHAAADLLPNYPHYMSLVGRG
jgi:membrane protease YdiL (CAAX protease family)